MDDICEEFKYDATYTNFTSSTNLYNPKTKNYKETIYNQKSFKSFPNPSIFTLFL